MLEDHKRTGAYYNAVMQNRRQFHGKVRPWANRTEQSPITQQRASAARAGASRAGHACHELDREQSRAAGADGTPYD